MNKYYSNKKWYADLAWPFRNGKFMRVLSLILKGNTDKLISQDAVILESMKTDIKSILCKNRFQLVFWKTSSNLATTVGKRQNNRWIGFKRADNRWNIWTRVLIHFKRLGGLLSMRVMFRDFSGIYTRKMWVNANTENVSKTAFTQLSTLWMHILAGFRLIKVSFILPQQENFQKVMSRG